jgi:xanthine dehydrogenase YagR molybdenum-binding subunit
MADSIASYKDPNPVTTNRSGLIGRAVNRYEGPLKVSGTAPYSYEVETPAPPAYGYILGAEIGCGRITAVDATEALAQPGVRLVWSPANPPVQAQRGAKLNPRSQAAAEPVFDDWQVKFFGQPVAFACADTWEAARDAAHRIRITYEAAPGAHHFDGTGGEQAPRDEDSRVGNFENAFATAPVTLDEVYSTPIQNHCQMEPCATTAWWDGDHLTVHTSNQSIKRPQHLLAETLQIDRANIHLMSRYIGGGFGGKGPSYEDLTLAALAARDLGQPVKVAFTRRNMFQASIHRPATSARIRLGAEANGRLTAMAMEVVTHCAKHDPFTEHAAGFARDLYAAPNRLTGHKRVYLDLPVAGAMRAPGEASGMMSLECAMDELAEELGIDPFELRLRNEPDVHPETGAEFSSRMLVECMNEVRDRFGWAARNPRPGQVRDGRWLVGMGMAAAIRGNFLLPARASMRVEADGTVTVRQGMTDIGTGTYTILAQITAETMGVSIDNVVVEIGDSGFAPAPGSGGQFGAASAGTAVLATGMVLRAKLAEMAVADPASPLFGAPAASVDFRDGLIAAQNRAEPIGALVSRLAPSGVEVEGGSSPPPDSRSYAQHTYGAHCCEVGVDVVTGEVRLRRMLGVFAAGRILNAKTARSQLTGGMIWGVSAALQEANPVDPRYGSFISQDLGGYMISSHADIVNLDAVILEEIDDKANPMHIKGVGELGICGAAAAVANAVYNACGARVRDYPLTPDKVLPFLPAMG